MKNFLLAALAVATLVVFAAPAAEATSAYYRDGDRSIGYTNMNQWGAPRRHAPPRHAPAPPLSQAEEARLNELLGRKAIQVMGPPPANANFGGFEPTARGQSHIHCAGGRVIQSAAATGGKFYRVKCP